MIFLVTGKPFRGNEDETFFKHLKVSISVSSNHSMFSEFKVQRTVRYRFVCFFFSRVMWLLLEVYYESTVPVIGNGVHSFKPSKI